MTVYVLSPDNNKPSGGIKILYRHADVLNRNGIEAAVLHQQSGFRCDWFNNTTQLAYLPDVRLTENDFLVIPEIYGPNIANISQAPNIGPKPRKVIFNQNCRYTFLGQTLETLNQPDFDLAYNNRDEFVGAMVVSEDSKAYLEYVFPGLPVWRVHNSINTEQFSFSSEKKKQICFMPRKNPDEALQVIGILKLLGALQDFEVVAIENKNEAGVAEILKESMIFLSFGYPEGCPLPPAEAMACGCLVVGYDGFGGREYFNRDFSWPIAVGDITTYAETVRQLIELSRNNPRELEQKAAMASEYVSNTYSPEKEEEDIVGIWKALLN